MRASIVPNFIKAKTPEALRKEMLNVQLKKQRKMNFYSIMFDGKFYVAWYEDSYGG